MYGRFFVIAILVLIISFGFNFGFSQSTAESIHQPLVEDGELVLISFVVENSSKIFTIAIAEDESYIVYRFGEEGNIEIEFPEKTADSWNQFTYSHYARAVGNAHALLDINYLDFTMDNSKYIVYDAFAEEFVKSFVGTTVTNLTTGTQSDLAAVSQAKIGNLSQLLLNSKVPSRSVFETQAPSMTGQTIEFEGTDSSNIGLIALEEDLRSLEAEITNSVDTAEQSLNRVEAAFRQLQADTTNFQTLIAYWRVEDETNLENVRTQVRRILSNQEPVEQLITQFGLANAEESKTRYLIDIEAYSDSMSVLGDELELLENAAINSFNESRAIYNR